MSLPEESPAEKTEVVAAEAATPRSDLWLKAFLVGRKPKWTLVRIVVLVVTTFILFKFIFIPIEVVGVSMAPNFVEGQLHLVNKLAYRNAEPKRGDVVAVRMKTEKVVLLKRVIGLPGDHVGFFRGKIYINGQPLEESYVKLSTHRSWSRRAETVPKGQYFVVGDNRSMRFEDHFWYFAEKKEILGKVRF